MESETEADPDLQLGVKWRHGGLGRSPKWVPGAKPHQVRGTKSSEADDIFLFERLVP